MSFKVGSISPSLKKTDAIAWIQPQFISGHQVGGIYSWTNKQVIGFTIHNPQSLTSYQLPMQDTFSQLNRPAQLECNSKEIWELYIKDV